MTDWLLTIQLVHYYATRGNKAIPIIICAVYILLNQSSRPFYLWITLRVVCEIQVSDSFVCMYCINFVALLISHTLSATCAAEIGSIVFSISSSSAYWLLVTHYCGVSVQMIHHPVLVLLWLSALFALLNALFSFSPFIPFSAAYFLKHSYRFATYILECAKININ